MSRSFQMFALLLSGAGFSGLVHAVLPPFVIKTYGEHRAGNIVYHHRVTNNSACRIGSFSIAMNDPTDHGELTEVFPLGYQMMDDVIAPGATLGLPGWTADIIQIEHGGEYLEWTSISETPGVPSGQRLLPGQTSRFSVTVPKMDAVYLTGHFSAYLGGSPCATVDKYNGIMERLDTTPPALTVTFTPATVRANGGLVAVKATIAVKDDYDPQPEIKLLHVSSYVAGDVAGAVIGTDDRQFRVRAQAVGSPKIYTVIYSATDGSCNESRARANITITP